MGRISKLLSKEAHQLRDDLVSVCIGFILGIAPIALLPNRAFWIYAACGRIFLTIAGSVLSNQELPRLTSSERGMLP